MHMSQLMPMPLTVSCFSKIQIGFTFLVPAHLGSPGERAVKRVCVCASLTVSTYLIPFPVFLFVTVDFVNNWQFFCEFISSVYVFTMPPPDSTKVSKVVVHPLVLLSVVDHFNRMKKIGSMKRVVGVLLGSNRQGVLDVSNSFAGLQLADFSMNSSSYKGHCLRRICP